MLCPPSDWRRASLPAGRMSSWPNPWYGLLVTYHSLFTCCVRSDPVETDRKIKFLTDEMFCLLVSLQWLQVLCFDVSGILFIFFLFSQVSEKGSLLSRAHFISGHVAPALPQGSCYPQLPLHFHRALVTHNCPCTSTRLLLPTTAPALPQGSCYPQLPLYFHRAVVTHNCPHSLNLSAFFVCAFFPPVLYA